MTSTFIKFHKDGIVVSREFNEGVLGDLEFHSRGTNIILWKRASRPMKKGKNFLGKLWKGIQVFEVKKKNPALIKSYHSRILYIIVIITFCIYRKVIHEIKRIILLFST